MEAWEHFEYDCTSYLNGRYGDKASFIHQGSANSNVADIRCITNTGRIFYIEAKQCPAQCGQFVLMPNVTMRKFVYSSGNSLQLNEYSQSIIDHMNNDFDAYKDAGTSGKDIIFDGCNDVFINWVKRAYEKKKVEYFITNNYRIFKLSELADNFIISAKYRVKRSGSKNVGDYRMIVVKQCILSKYGISSTRTDDGKLFVSTGREMNNIKFDCGDYEYMFSKRGSEYEIRQLSNTFNANVIFSVSLKNPGTDISNRFSDELT